jgi:hypothetical protein
MIVWLLIVFAVGCGKDHFEDMQRAPRRDDPRPPAEKRPLSFEWNKEEATLSGGGTLSVLAYKGKYHVTLSDVRKIGAQSGKVEGSRTVMDVEVGDKLATRTFAELEQVDPEAELELELQDGRTGKTKLPPANLVFMIGDALKNAEHAPVLFGNEPDDPKKQDSMYWPEGPITRRVVGKSGKLYEIDWVLVVHQLPGEKGRRVCTGYTSGGKPAPDITVVFKDSEATIFDRRTGNVVEKKVFGPNKDCPSFTMQRAGQETTDGMSPYAEIEAWARTRVKR